jgi:uncharacterized protein (DUF302 family)
MSYYFSKTVAMPIATAISHVTNKLASKGFGVLTSIDVKQVMKAKLGADFKPYVILGACNPHFAWRALQTEDRIGTMLPCNVVIMEVGPGQVEIAAVDPVASMGAIGNPALAQVAQEVRRLLEDMVREL